VVHCNRYKDNYQLLGDMQESYQYRAMTSSTNMWPGLQQCWKLWKSRRVVALINDSLLVGGALHCNRYKDNYQLLGDMQESYQHRAMTSSTNMWPGLQQCWKLWKSRRVT
jgi:hypothetical protein